MIAIRLNDEIRGKIEGLHLSYFEVFTKERLDFYIHFFSILRSIRGGKNVTSVFLTKRLVSDRPFNGNTSNSLINATLSKDQSKLKNETYFQLTKVGVIDLWLMAYRQPILEGLVFLKKHLSEILIAPPSRLIDLSKDFQRIVLIATPGKKSLKGAIKRVLRKIFSYKEFGGGNEESQEDLNNINSPAYQLAKRLNQKVCPYCNRLYTFTVDKADLNNKFQKYTRPEFDHFFSQKDYPELSLSLYNLVPSCGVCNRNLKRDLAFTHKEYLHPYERGFEKDSVFRYRAQTLLGCLGISSELEIKLENRTQDRELRMQIENNSKVFKLNELYTQHADRAADIIFQSYVSNERYLQLLNETFGLKLTKAELYKLAFGNHLDTEEWGNSPLAKFTHDIAEQAGLLDYL